MDEAPLPDDNALMEVRAARYVTRRAAAMDVTVDGRGCWWKERALEMRKFLGSIRAFRGAGSVPNSALGGQGFAASLR